MMNRHVSKIPRTRWLILAAVFALVLVAAASSAPSQSMNSVDRDRGRIMLDMIKSDLKKYYYDPNYRGMKLDERFKTADDKIKQATSLGQVFGIIAQVLLELEDSHAYFIPPSRTTRTDYGWQMQAIGDRCFVAAVKPGSDADVKGLKPGDEILSIDEFGPTRENLWKLSYLYYKLRPRGGMRVIVQSANGQQRQLDIIARVRQEKQHVDLTGEDINQMIRENEDEDRLRAHRYIEMADELLIWKMPQFDLTDQGVDDMMGKVLKRKSLILDLRGNGGGAVVTLKRLLGYFFDHDVKIADLKGRKEMKPMIAQSRGGGRVFKGKLVVLVDSKSASASELFARVVQLEKRGSVIGDRTAGMVMEARRCDHQSGADTVIAFGASITDADLIMVDGKSLEHAGVTPDELLLPAPADLAAKRDPVMSRAAQTIGVKIEPERAGAMFPIEWKK